MFKKHLRPGRSLADLAGEKQPNRLIGNTMKPFIENVQNCYEGVVEYMDAWKKFDGAGTHLVDALNHSIGDSEYRLLGLETSQAFSIIHASSNGIDPSGKLKEMEKLLVGLKSHLESVENMEKTKSHLQVLCQCVLLFLKVQSDYHQLCSVTIATLLNKLIHNYKTSDTKDVLQQMSDLDLMQRESPSRSFSSLKKKSPSASPKLSAKHHLKSSFLSWFERKNATDDSNSAFYVDLDRPNTDQSESTAACQSSQLTCRPNILVQVGLDPVQESDGNGHMVANVHFSTHQQQTLLETEPILRIHEPPEEKNSLATEEELDCVINLLSGITGSRNHMETIHENHLTVPTLYPSRTPSPGSNTSSLFPSRTPSPGGSSDENTRITQNPTQRRSEGSLDFTGLGHTRGNTWPHRCSLPTGSLTSLGSFYDGRGHGNTIPRGYLHDTHYTSRTNYGGFPSGNLLSAYPGGCHESKYRPWMNKSTPSSQGSDILHSSWPALQDSDDLSDDSSLGEPFFAMGLDLVNALDSNQDCSSEEDIPRKQSDTTDIRDKQHEKHSTNTWPPKQTWTQVNHLTQPQDHSLQHRPVSMQWSDPLANRSLWPSPGLGASQSLQGFESSQ